MARTQGPSEEAVSVSEGSSSDDYSVATSSDEEDTCDGKPEKERNTRKKPKRVEAEMYIECDKQASVVSKAELEGSTNQEQNVLQPPHPGSRAMLKMKGKWMLSRIKETIHRAHTTSKMRKHYNARLKWR